VQFPDDTETWDFFISYTQADRPWAEWIAWQLEERGYRVLIQAWDFVGGNSWIHSMQEGVTRAERTLAVLSDAYLESVYGGAEWQVAWAADPTGKNRKLLTVRVANCERPGLLGGVVSDDLFDVTQAIARQRLDRLVDGAVAGRLKPELPPAFPSSLRAVSRPAPFPPSMARIWNVPARNPNFTGRDEKLAELDHLLNQGPAVTVSAVHGMGGVGKTQLASEYAHTHTTRYEVVWWVASETTASIPDQFAALATRLGLEQDGDPASIRSAVHDQLRQVRGWLLIFDNADSVTDIREWIPSSPQQLGIPGHVLVTTRRSGFKAVGPVIDLDVLDLDLAVELIRTRTAEIDRPVATEIAEFLGCLPLALEQAAAFLDTTGMPAPEYLGLLQTRTEELLSRGSVADRGDTTVATLWDISLQQIEPRTPAAIQLLELCAYLAPEAIPLDLFTRHADLLPNPLAQAAADPLKFSDLLTVLVDFSLAKRKADGLQLHRLVQAAIRSRQPTPIYEPLPSVLKLLEVDLPADIMDAPQDWPRWTRLLPHVLAATGHRLVQPIRDMSGAQLSVSLLLDTSGSYLQVHGRAREARPLLEQALAIDQALYGQDNPAVTTALNNLALVLRDLGDPAAARPLLEQALTIDQDAYGRDHPSTATDLNNLALVLQDLGDPAAARPLLEQALTIAQATYGHDHSMTATALNNFATVLQDLGEPASARPLLEQALAVDQSNYGFEHPAVASDMGNLATVLWDLGERTAARQLLEHSLAIFEAVYGPDHPTVANGQKNLASVLHDLGEDEASQRLLERARAIEPKQEPPAD
jgi:tetratricopeptide (TPR) repeat protein